MKPDNLICELETGSHSYGTNVATSDLDVRGIFVGRPRSIRTPFFHQDEQTDSSKTDSKYFELNKFMTLAVACNPNIVELLWVDRSSIIQTSTGYEMLRTVAPRLLSRQIIDSTMGYAKSQLSRMKNHYNMANNPCPADPPKQIDYLSLVYWLDPNRYQTANNRVFNVSEFATNFQLVRLSTDLLALHPSIPGEYHESFNPSTFTLNITDVEFKHKLPPAVAILRFGKDRYDADLIKWQRYWDWKNLKDAKVATLEVLRAEYDRRNQPKSQDQALSTLAKTIKVTGVLPQGSLVDQLSDTDLSDLIHSFVRHEVFQTDQIDYKHAMHLVRLMRMAHEIVTTGLVVVRRPDANELLDIRNGKWSYEDIMQHANELDRKINETRPMSSLRAKPDYDLASTVIMKIQDMVWT